MESVAEIVCRAVTCSAVPLPRPAVRSDARHGQGERR
jgi:hypothetical protein